MTIDLAPNHKRGFLVTSPILVAGGGVGYGEAKHTGLDLTGFGAVVVGPIMRRSARGGEPPRVAEVNGGLVLDSGLQNRGVTAVIKKFARLWPRLGSPVVAQIADSQPELVAEVAARLAAVDCLSGLELLVPHYADVNLLRRLIQAADHAGDLPLWVKLPLLRASELATAAVDAGAAGLVIGQPPRGAGHHVGYTADRWVQRALIHGPLYGPAAFSSMLAVLADVAELHLPTALIACGGIHTPDQARQVLAVGAHGLQIDSALWIEPGVATRIVASLG